MSTRAVALIVAIGAASTVLLTACGEKMPEVNIANCDGGDAFAIAKKAGLSKDGVDEYLRQCEVFSEKEKKRRKAAGEPEPESPGLGRIKW